MQRRFRGPGRIWVVFLLEISLLYTPRIYLFKSICFWPFYSSVFLISSFSIHQNGTDKLQKREESGWDYGRFGRSSRKADATNRDPFIATYESLGPKSSRKVRQRIAAFTIFCFIKPAGQSEALRIVTFTVKMLLNGTLNTQVYAKLLGRNIMKCAFSHF